MPDFVKLQFSSSTAWQSGIIRKLCHSPFSHVDLVLPDGNLLGASDSPTAPYVTGNPRGVAVRPPYYQEFYIRREAIIKTDKAEAIISWIFGQLGKPFDDSGLHSFMTDKIYDRNWRAPDKWFCSELKACGFESGGYWTEELMWPKDRISPTDLLLLFMFDSNFVNRKAFWEPILGLQIGMQER